VVKPSTSQRSPLSPTRWPTDAFLWTRSLIAFAIIATAFILGQIFEAFIAGALGTSRADLLAAHLTWGIAIGQYASYLPLVAVIVIVLPWLARRSLHDLGLDAITPRILGTGIGGAVAMYAVTIGAAQLQLVLTHQKPEETALTLFQSAHDPGLVIAFGALAAVAAPIAEELVFRGFLFNAILRYTPMWLAAAISGALFGLSHGSLSAALPLAGAGVVLAYVYYTSGSLTAAMVTHGLFNLINVLLIAFFKVS
jgi:membrane protease YdiL (CAAX protease family)